MARKKKRAGKKKRRLAAGTEPASSRSAPRQTTGQKTARSAPPAPQRRWMPAVVVLVLLLAVYPIGVWLGWFSAPGKDLEAKVNAMLGSEHLLLDATPELRRLARSVQNLELPDHQSRGLFSSRVEVVDLAGAPVASENQTITAARVMEREWPVQDRSRTTEIGELSLMSAMFEDVDYFEHAKFYFIDGDYLLEDQEEWESEMGFHALARLTSGAWRDFHGKLEFGWEKVSEEEGVKAWRISKWELREMHSMEVEKMPFADVLDAAVTDPVALERARTSIHEKMVAHYLFDIEKPKEQQTFEMPHPYFLGPSQDRHPGVAIADVDGDGLDDLYVMARWGENLLFRSRGDGTYEEVAGRYNLDFKNYCSAAVFADFDNDGDQDLFLGRTLYRSHLLMNEGGFFVDSALDLVDILLPGLVSAVTAADYNGDGLLDIYISTYASGAMITEMQRSGVNPILVGTDSLNRSKPLLVDALAPADVQHLHDLLNEPEHDYHIYRNNYGPPNILLRNVGGGRFVEAKEVKELRLFRHTYQSTWGDYDNDGDPDLYLANDFAPNNLFRNEGNGHFTDVTGETGTKDIGFGMGVSWGDYDRDGLQDLYISNMYSKAGKRITGKIPNINPVFSAMAKGNSLFNNRGDRFEKVSGTDENTVQVELAGWSWGGQFADFDNDGWLDVYALSGNYTAPKQIESQVDM